MMLGYGLVSIIFLGMATWGESWEKFVWFSQKSNEKPRPLQLAVKGGAIWVPRGEALWRMGKGRRRLPFFLAYAFQRERKISAPSLVM